MKMTGTNQMLGEPESLFSSAPIRGQIESEIESLKARLLLPVLASIANTDLVKELAWAANEAAALAWLTFCPVLVLPALLKEKIQHAVAIWQKQERVRQQ